MNEQHTGWPAGLKKTRPRENVLAALSRADKPLSAPEICAAIEKSGEDASLSTVYRILELFVQKNLVVKISVQNSDSAIYALNRFEHKHYAVCLGCRKIVTMDNCPLERVMPNIADADFRVMGHNLEIYGYCKDCDPKGE